MVPILHSSWIFVGNLMNTILFFRVVSPYWRHFENNLFREYLSSTKSMSFTLIQVFRRKIIALKKLYFPTGFPCQQDSGKSLTPSGKKRKTPTTDFDRYSFKNPWINVIHPGWMISVPHDLASSQCLMHCTMGWLWSMIILYKLVPCTIYRGIKNIPSTYTGG